MALLCLGPRAMSSNMMSYDHKDRAPSLLPLYTPSLAGQLTPGAHRFAHPP